jgi:hypothetical protein
LEHNADVCLCNKVQPIPYNANRIALERRAWELARAIWVGVQIPAFANDFIPRLIEYYAGDDELIKP